jgi:transposase-like protein
VSIAEAEERLGPEPVRRKKPNANPPPRDFDAQVRDGVERGRTVNEIAEELGCHQPRVSEARARLGMTRRGKSPARALAEMLAPMTMTLQSTGGNAARLCSASPDDDVVALVAALKEAGKAARRLMSEINARNGHGETDEVQ